uniref:Uncharacterized protein n=1 Tax=Plectus sambesii TaxID=2011161 RepID=A0A914VU15_9BILA
MMIPSSQRYGSRTLRLVHSTIAQSSASYLTASTLLPQRAVRGCSSLLSVRKSTIGGLIVAHGVNRLAAAGLHTSTVNHKAKDYYQVLGVKKDASGKDIKKAYYQLAKKFHPDVNKEPEAAKKFQEVSEAYEILSDDGKRQQYDQFGVAHDFSGAGAPGAGQGGSYQGFHSTVDPEELFRRIFGSAFGGKGGKGGTRSGAFDFSDFDFGEQQHAGSNFGFAAAQEETMHLTFQEAARGVNKNIALNVVDTCAKCKGSKCEPNRTLVSCPHCNGTGMETFQQGMFLMRQTCRKCSGSGSFNKNPCIECEGKGNTVQRKTVTVPVPAGIEDGQTVRMTVGKREVYIHFKVSPSSQFRREGADVHTDVTISLAQAMLGGTVKVPGIYEDTNLQVPAGTSSHARLRLTGKGIKKLDARGHGDQYINFRIAIPKKLTETQRAIIQAWAEMETDTPGTVSGITQTTEGRREAKKAQEKEGTKGTVVDEGAEQKASGILGKIKRAIFG